MSTKKSKKVRAKPTPRVGPLMSSDERRVKALSIAVPMAAKTGAGGVSIKSVAQKMKCSAPLLFHIFGTSADFGKAIAKQAKKEGVTLPTTTVTVRMQAAIKSRAAAKKSNGLGRVAIKAPKLAKLVQTPISPKRKEVKANHSLVTAPRKRGIAEVKAIKNKLAAVKLPALLKPPIKPMSDAKAPKLPSTPAAKVRKPLSPAQKAAKRDNDAARRAVKPALDPKTPLGKFAALPSPMQASIDAVS